MTLMRIASHISLLMVLWFTSCARPQQTQQSHEMITEAKALELAKAEFAKTGRNVSDYGVTIETDSTGQKWIAWFDKKSAYATPGGKHGDSRKSHGQKGVYVGRVTRNRNTLSRQTV